MKIVKLMIIILAFSSFVFSQEAIKQDEFQITSCEDYLSRMAHLKSVVEHNLNAKTYVLIYEGKEFLYNTKKHKNELVLPAFGTAKAKIHSIKMLFKSWEANSSLKQIVFVEAGFREHFTIEFWFVPNGATPPKPTPTLKKMKYRKGKAQGFCPYAPS